MGSGIRTSIKIEGLDQLRRAMRTLPVELQKKAMGDATAAGAAVIRDEAIARAPELKMPHAFRVRGLLKRMITSTRGVRRDSEASAFVRVKRLVKKALSRAKSKSGLSFGELDPFYWAFEEFGTSKAPATPFMRPAFDTKKEAAANAIRDKLAEELPKAAAKVSGRRLW